jgi:hypothetical protein
MDFSAEARLCPLLRLSVFEEAADDVRDTLDPMPRPSLLPEMCEEEFDICQPHLSERFACRVFQEIGKLTLCGGDSRFGQASIFCHVPTVRIEFGLMRSSRTSRLLQPPGEAQPTTGDIAKLLLRPFRPRRHRVEVPAMRPVSCSAFDRRSFHWTRVVQIHADSRTIQHTGVRAQAVQSGTARSEVFQISEP